MGGPERGVGSKRGRLGGPERGLGSRRGRVGGPERGLGSKRRRVGEPIARAAEVGAAHRPPSLAGANSHHRHPPASSPCAASALAGTDRQYPTSARAFVRSGVRDPSPRLGGRTLLAELIRSQPHSSIPRAACSPGGARTDRPTRTGEVRRRSGRSGGAITKRRGSAQSIRGDAGPAPLRSVSAPLRCSWGSPPRYDRRHTYAISDSDSLLIMLWFVGCATGLFGPLPTWGTREPLDVKDHQVVLPRVVHHHEARHRLGKRMELQRSVWPVERSLCPPCQPVGIGRLVREELPGGMSAGRVEQPQRARARRIGPAARAGGNAVLA